MTEGQYKADSGKVQFSLLVPGFVRGMAQVLTIGAHKPGYTRHGWQNVPDPIERYYDSLCRHLDAWRSGERYDIGDGGTYQHHLLCVGVNAMILWWHDLRGTDGESTAGDGVTQTDQDTGGAGGDRTPGSGSL